MGPDSNPKYMLIRWLGVLELPESLTVNSCSHLDLQTNIAPGIADSIVGVIVTPAEDWGRPESKVDDK